MLNVKPEHVIHYKKVLQPAKYSELTQCSLERITDFFGLTTS